MKWIIRFLGASLVIVGLWYVIMMYVQLGHIDTSAHLDLASMVQRFHNRFAQGGAFGFQDITSLINSCKETLLKINQYNPARMLADTLLGNDGSFWSTAASVAISIFSPTFSMVSSVTMLGYGVAIVFEFISILFFTIEPFLQFVFEPIFV